METQNAQTPDTQTTTRLRKRFTRLDNESYAFRKRYEAVVLPLGTKFNDAEFMQYRNPVGFGPSSNT